MSKLHDSGLQQALSNTYLRTNEVTSICVMELAGRTVQVNIDFSNEHEKDIKFNALRLLFKNNGVSSYALVLESWMSRQSLNGTTRPSLADDREEMMTWMVNAGSGPECMYYWSINRHQLVPAVTGERSKFEQSLASSTGRTYQSSRFSNLLDLSVVPTFKGTMKRKIEREAKRMEKKLRCTPLIR